MADSYLLQVEKSLCNLISDSIIGVPVFRGRLRYGAREPVPMISIMQAPDIDVSVDGICEGIVRSDSKTWLIQGWVEDDIDNPTDPAHELMALVKQALSKAMVVDDENYLLGGLIDKITVSMGLVRPPEMEISNKAYFWLPVTLRVTENISSPFTVQR